MQDYNKSNLKRLVALFAACIIVFVAAINVSVDSLWASVPTSLAAVACAVILFKTKYIDKE